MTPPSSPRAAALRPIRGHQDETYCQLTVQVLFADGIFVDPIALEKALGPSCPKGRFKCTHFDPRYAERGCPTGSFETAQVNVSMAGFDVPLSSESLAAFQAYPNEVSEELERELRLHRHSLQLQASAPAGHRLQAFCCTWPLRW